MSDDPSGAPVHQALIVAGGRGTRLQPLTHDLPKPLIPFCGAPFLVGVIRRLAAAGVDHVRLVVGVDIEPFTALEPVCRRHGVELEMVPEPEPLDTAGGVRSVAGELDGPVFVLNGDILSDVDYATVGRRHVESGADATMVLTELDETASYGVAVRDGQRIRRFVEKPPAGTVDDRTINAGTYVLQPDVLLAHPEGRLSFERDVFPDLLARGGHLEGVVWDGVWADLGTPERYREGHRLALNGAMDWPSLRDVPEREPGVRVAPSVELHPDAKVVAPVLILDDAVIEAGATIGPSTVVGGGSRVGSGAVLEGAVLHDRVTIGEGVDAPGLLAGEGASIESGATVGRDVVLGSGERIEAHHVLDHEERRPQPWD